MAANRQSLVLSGYYGFKNSGDEAVLKSILLALEEEGAKQGVLIAPIVLSADPAWTEKMYGIQAIHRMKPLEVISAIRNSHGLISGGGSLLQDITGSMTIPYYLGILKLAQWTGKPTFIYSQGIGPVHRKNLFPLICHTFNKCQYVSVRDRESAELLHNMGFSAGKVEVVPDPVMGLPLRLQKNMNVEKQPSHPRPIIGVSVRYWNKDRSELEQLARCLQIIIEQREVEIRFLPFHLPTDVSASHEVIERMKVYCQPNEPDDFIYQKVYNRSFNDISQVNGFASKDGTSRLSLRKSSVLVVKDVLHPQDMLAQVSQCDVLIGMRLHSLIYAASQYVPMAGISYDPKIDQFLHRLQITAAASTEAFQPEKTAAEVFKLLDTPRLEWLAAKRSLIDQLKVEAQQPAKRIVTFLRNKLNNVK